MTEEIVTSAMQIILHAGDARNACTQALSAIEENNFDLAEEKMKIATAEITKAHQVQTDAIQAEAAGEKESQYSLLFAHAQDTLMTIYSEINIAKNMIKIFRSYEKRISQLEGKSNV